MSNPNPVVLRGRRASPGEASEDVYSPLTEAELLAQPRVIAALRGARSEGARLMRNAALSECTDVSDTPSDLYLQPGPVGAQRCWRSIAELDIDDIIGGES